MKKYVFQYARDQISAAKNSKFMLNDIKQDYIQAINRALQAYTRGLITTDEAMKLITRPLD